MQRTIVTPAVLAPAALAELKLWLGVTTTADDAPLTGLLAAALETCEGFTGLMPLEAVCEEVLPVFWDDNYFELFPGEARDIRVGFPRTAAPPRIEVEGLNVSTS